MTRSAKSLAKKRAEALKDFDPVYYLERYPDIKKAVACGQLENPEDHYVGWGRQEGRFPSAVREHANKVPVLFCIFNRPEITAVTWERIRAYKPGRLFVVSDAARNAKEELLVEQTRKITEQIDWNCVVKRNYAPQNMGCKNRIVSGLQWLFSQVEDGVILEDDCLPHPDFFDFCFRMLEIYRDDQRVMHVSGSCFVEMDKTSRPGWLSRHSDIWGWATWRRAFRHYDPDMKTWRRPLPWFGKWLGDGPLEREYWATHFDKVKRGEIDTWDYQWHYSVMKRRGRCVVPGVNLISNIGHGAAATHTKDEANGIDLLRTFPMGAVPMEAVLQHNGELDALLFMRRYAVNSMPKLPSVEPPITRCPEPPCDVVICHNEITARHGVGALLKRLLGDREDWFNIRTTTHFEDPASLPRSTELSVDDTTPNRVSAFRDMARFGGEHQVRSILCVPYREEEALRAIALKAVTRAPLTVYLMDDQNIHSSELPDGPMKELLEQADQRFAICREMSEAYCAKYKVSVETLYPALDHADLRAPNDRRSMEAIAPKGVLIGNLWTDGWMRRFANAVRSAGLQVDWYGNAAGRFRGVSEEELTAAGVRLAGFLNDDELLPVIRGYDYALIPTACAVDDASHAWMAKLSFPSKIMTLVFGGGLPLLVLADSDNPAVSFVRNNRLGEVAEYDGEAIRAAIQRLTDPRFCEDFESTRLRLGPGFSLQEARNMLWDPA